MAQHKYAEMTLGGQIGRIFSQLTAIPDESIKIYEGKKLIRPVVTVDLPTAYDEELYYLVGPEYEVEDERVLEKFSLRTSPNFMHVLLRRLDEKAEEQRMHYLPKGSGQVMTEMMKEDEARDWLNRGDDWKFEDFPMLNAWFQNPSEERFDAKAKEWLDFSNRIRAIFGTIERTRQLTAQAIKDAPHHDDMMRVFAGLRWGIDKVGLGGSGE